MSFQLKIVFKCDYYIDTKQNETFRIIIKSILGYGSFNWRFIHKFKYAYLERKVIVPDEIEDKKYDPIVTLNISDADPSISPLPYGGYY